MTDAEILALYNRAACGDQDAWSTLYASFTRSVRSWSIRSGGLPDDLDDIGSMAWCSLWSAMRSGKQFTSGAAVLAFLAQCTRNRTVDTWRRTQTHPRYAEFLDRYAVTPEQYTLPILDELQKNERKLAILLMSGYSCNEIAVIAHVSLGTVYVWRRHLRKKLISKGDHGE